jgi:hypothetical protein
MVTIDSKTTYMKLNRNITSWWEEYLIMNGQVFEGVQNFRYLGALINPKKFISDEIKSRIAVGNRCFYSLRQIFRYRAMSQTVKIKINKR